MRKIVIAGNWKMYKTNQEAVQVLRELKDLTKDIKNIDIVIGVPFTALSDAVKAVEGSNIKVAAENVYPKAEGAFTGEISPTMLKAIGVSHVILGHSERREIFKETDEFINEKVKAVLENGLTPIFCIGEKLEEREAGKTFEVNSNQVKKGLKGLTKEEAKRVIVAYEPVWAIGTGKTATPEIAQETHKEIRKVLVDMFGQEIANEMTIQYGGSMKPENAKELLSQVDIDGGLVGGASLKADSFFEIIRAAN
ncbi:MAG: triose-phosphate isomerase [Fusobacterium sp.]|uniref:triose-phosphate isomerase n=1 Tax=Fusobacterium sp. TaxID=68766 RepID=UPI0026DADFF1|nr:triose-phosphate isomerase [Fusobacterium sp.]MDO4690884.1 triose-phosphate isomerase [Fusobacterium sp.]